MTNLPTDVVVGIVIGVLCLCFSAFFSAAETAITSLGELKTKHLLEGAKGKSAHLKMWLDHPGRVLTTILILNNAVNIFASAITTKIAIEYFANYALGYATGIATFLILIFGEITPKSFAKTHADSLAEISLKFVYFLYLVILPIAWPLASLATYIVKVFGSKESALRPQITEEELEFLINEGESAGVIDDYKKDMISGVFDFDETKVREIMTPRTDIVAIEKNDDFSELVKLILKTGHSRIPVYDETIDVIVGIIFAKDLLRLPTNGDAKGLPKISSLMRDAFFVPESRSNIDVFKDLKKSKMQMAIVIDEHGGTAGLVTMEDILEEIVGEIQDEYDVEEAKILEIENNIFDVAGSVNISEFLEYFELDEDLLAEIEKDVDTIAGFVTQKIGTMPRVGQSTDLGLLNLEVSEIGRNRIERLRVTKGSTPMMDVHQSFQ